MTDTSDASQTVKENRINLATYNIRSGRGGNSEIVLRAMELMNVDLGILTEAKLTDGIYNAVLLWIHRGRHERQSVQSRPFFSVI
jgi:hypothetical protein